MVRTRPAQPGRSRYEKRDNHREQGRPTFLTVLTPDLILLSVQKDRERNKSKHDPACPVQVACPPLIEILPASVFCHRVLRIEDFTCSSTLPQLKLGHYRQLVPPLNAINACVIISPSFHRNSPNRASFSGGFKQWPPNSAEPERLSAGLKNS